MDEVKNNSSLRRVGIIIVKLVFYIVLFSIPVAVVGYFITSFLSDSPSAGKYMNECNTLGNELGINTEYHFGGVFDTPHCYASVDGKVVDLFERK